MSSEDKDNAPASADLQNAPSSTGTPLSVSSSTEGTSFIPLVTVVGFHHARGPEVESWFGAEDGVDPAVEYQWSLLPFMALSDGAHASEEDFSYFTLLKPESPTGPATSLFGISCTRQLDSSHLINRPADVTRSTVQKAVVVIADNPQGFGMLRERLSVVTKAWFAQREFTDVEILKRFQESLAEEKVRGLLQGEPEHHQYLGMSLRELIHEFRWQTLVLLKCCLLQPKMLFFGSRCDRLCMVQFSLISLIPGLLQKLQDCADPELNTHETKLSKPTSLKSSNRSSLLSFMGLPLQIFGKGSLFGPYTPLQQLDILADFGTKSYIVGSTNSLLLQQKDRYSDILINLDDNTINITSTSLRHALALTAADRRWIDFLTIEVSNTWDDANPSRPKTMQYAGSEEFIRSQFEAYILGLISSVKYHNYLVQHPDSHQPGEPDPAVDYGLDWVEAWSRTENYRMWDTNTDTNVFAVSEPRHPCAGGLNIEDVQRRMAEQIKDLHLDERFAQAGDLLGRNLALGRDKASTIFTKLYNDVEQLREAQRRRPDEVSVTSEKSGVVEKTTAEVQSTPVQAAKPQQTAGARASAYMSSWATWAGEKRKASGWGAGWGKKSSTTAKSDKSISTPTSPIEKDYQIVKPAGDVEAAVLTEDILVPANTSKGAETESAAGKDVDTPQGDRDQASSPTDSAVQPSVATESHSADSPDPKVAEQPEVQEEAVPETASKGSSEEKLASAEPGAAISTTHTN
ncbi:hypothetical protein V2G26_006812 [Clonostachys chloroleuca]